MAVRARHRVQAAVRTRTREAARSGAQVPDPSDAAQVSDSPHPHASRSANASDAASRRRSAGLARPHSIAASTIASVALTVLFIGCANRPPAPEWQSNAKSGLERAVAAYFVGNSRVEAQEFTRARSEIARTGRPALVARAELLRCASRTASLVLEACGGFDTVAADAEPAERAYAAYLAGRATAQEAEWLPEQHRPLVAAGATPATDLAALGRMDDPFSRLVGAAVSLQAGRAGPAIVALAVDAASAQGWRRPLLAWLEVQLRLAERDGDHAAAGRVRRRIGLVQGTPIAGMR